MSIDLQAFGRLRPYVRRWTYQPKPKGYRKGKLGQCYANAVRLMLDNSDLTYVEGFPRGFHHAWLVDPVGRVIDTTWINQPEIDYVGVPFRSQYVARLMLERRAFYDVFQHAQNAGLSDDLLKVEAVDVAEAIDFERLKLGKVIS